jgi:hypothetical protein
MMKKSKFTTWLSAFLICCLSVSFLGVGSVILPVSMVSVPAVYAYPNVSGNVTAALGYLDSIQANDGSIGTFANSVWAAIAIVAAGEDPDAGRWLEANGSLVDYLIDNQNQIDVSKATDVARFILAMESASVDSSNMGGTNYVNILMNLNETYDTDKYQIGDNTTLNDDFWGIMALVSAGVSTDNWLIENSTEFIKANQRAADDGWSWTTNMTYGSDADDTAAGIMALVAAGEGSSSNVADAIAYLKAEQDPTTGGFEYDDGVWPSSGVNSDSDSWAMCAIQSVGEAPFQWPLNDTNVVDHLLTLQDPATGSFNWTASYAGWDQVMPTINAILALRFDVFLNTTLNTNVTIELVGDFNDNGELDDTGFLNDEFLLELMITLGTDPPAFDLTGDGDVDNDDLVYWNDLKTIYDLYF